jgi:indolepyruvate ferredoxin oxidoreductase beta subunit
MSRFDRLMRAAAQLQGRPDAADALASLLAASLADAQGAALERQRQALALGPI